MQGWLKKLGPQLQKGRPRQGALVELIHQNFRRKYKKSDPRARPGALVELLAANITKLS